MNKILICIEAGNTKYYKDLINISNKIDKNSEIWAIVFSEGIDFENCDIDKVITVKCSQSDIYNNKVIAEYIKKIHDKENFDYVLFSATALGRMIAPRVAMELKTGLCADVTEIGKNGEDIVMVRPAFEGKLYASIICDTKPVMISVRPMMFKEDEKLCNTRTTNIYEDSITSKGSVVIKDKYKKPKNKDIRTSDVLVSGGSGIKNQFEKLYTLADNLGGNVSASRWLVDRGYVKRDIQVGQSGKIVSPKLYIALGIHGASQHVVGLKNVQHLISINTNKNAPICFISDIVVEGDAITFIEMLNKRIEEINS